MDVDQGSLRAQLASVEPRLLPADRALAVLRALSDTLFPLHASGQAHGCFGPENVEVAGATVTLAGGETAPAYVAPELRDGGEPSPAGDAYSFATIAHELLAGGLPTFAEDGTAVPITQAHPGFPAFAGEAIARSLQPDPAARPLPKVLMTLLQVVPADRWPAASQPEHQPEPAQPEPQPEPVVEHEPVVVDEESAGSAEPAREPAPAIANEEWHSTFAAAHEVPAIEWQSQDDPTRPSDEVPRIGWAPDADPDAAEEEPAARRTSDPGYLHDFVHALRPQAEVPAIEPLGEAIPVEQIEHRPGRRSRRKYKERSPDRIQKIVLVLILLALIACGAAWALTHQDSPQYDPKLQGASLSLVHPAATRT